MWRHWIRWIHEWAVYGMTDDDAERVGLHQAQMLREAAEAIEEAIETRNKRTNSGGQR